MVEPDPITTAKGITSSWAPLGAVLVPDAVVTISEEEGAEVLHGPTFGGHPVSCTAALADQDVMIKEELPGWAKPMGTYLRGQPEVMLGDHPNVGDVRGAGVYCRVEFVANRNAKTTPADPASLARPTGRMPVRGLIPCNDDRNGPATQLCPTLVITAEECDRVVAILVESIEKFGRRTGEVRTLHAADKGAGDPTGNRGGAR